MMTTRLLLLLLVEGVTWCQTTHTAPGTDVVGRIFQGLNAVRGQFPFQALLIQETYRNTSEFCGGALISTRHVLTAAHCSYRARTTQVYLGVVNTKDGEGVIYRTVDAANTAVHPLYDEASYSNDIAVLTLPSSLPLSGSIQTIRLPRLAWAPPSTFDNYVVTASGWGQTYDGEDGIHQVLQYRRVDKMSQEDCAHYYSDVLPVTDGMICTDKLRTNAGPCHGDSGGPLTVRLESGLYLVGVVSWGLGTCSSNNPVVYTNVAHYLPWISSVTGLPLY